MVNNLIIETLRGKITELQSEKKAANEVFDSQIQIIESEIQKHLNTRHDDDQRIGDSYDDESHSYIKSSQEEM